MATTVFEIVRTANAMASLLPSRWSSGQADPPASNRTGLDGDDGTKFQFGPQTWIDNPDAIVDICFVHGLGGNRTSTWTGSDGKPWPKTLLPRRVHNGRILTFGYDAYAVKAGVASSHQLVDHAVNFLTCLINDRVQNTATGRPIILVAQSLGGLLCKEAILRSGRKF